MRRKAPVFKINPFVQAMQTLIAMSKNSEAWEEVTDQRATGDLLTDVPLDDDEYDEYDEYDEELDEHHHSIDDNTDDKELLIDKLHQQLQERYDEARGEDEYDRIDARHFKSMEGKPLYAIPIHLESDTLLDLPMATLIATILNDACTKAAHENDCDAPVHFTPHFLENGSYELTAICHDPQMVDANFLQFALTNIEQATEDLPELFRRVKRGRFKGYEIDYNNKPYQKIIVALEEFTSEALSGEGMGEESELVICQPGTHKEMTQDEIIQFLSDSIENFSSRVKNGLPLFPDTYLRFDNPAHLRMLREVFPTLAGIAAPPAPPH